MLESSRMLLYGLRIQDPLLVGTQGQVLLRVGDVSVRYGDGPLAIQAVCRASFTLAAGEAAGLLGESGSGKSTLARALLGLLPSAAKLEGSIAFRGQELTSATDSELQRLRGAHIALIAQDPAQALNPVLTIGVQVSEVLRSHTFLSRSELKSRILETLGSVGFQDPAAISRRYAHQLSGGERQRAAIAQAIVCRPSLLIADEATSKLDPGLKVEVLELLESLRVRYDMALLLITHEPAVAASYAHRLLVMYAGEIVETGAKDSILRQPLHPYSQALIALARERSAIRGSGKPGQFAAIEGEPQPGSNLSGCYFQGRCSQRMPDCSARHPVLTHRDGHEVLCLKYE
jgi:oligopeptide/dipeptide ABC transporter ATP-binding protein